MQNFYDDPNGNNQAVATPDKPEETPNASVDGTINNEQAAAPTGAPAQEQPQAAAPQNSWGSPQGNPSRYPYQAYPYQQNTAYPYSNQQYAPPAPPKLKKKRNMGKKLFAVLVALAILVSGVGIGISLQNELRRPTENPTDPVGGIDNGPSVNFNQTPNIEPTTSVTGEMEPAEIYKKIKESSVGLLVYSDKNKSLFTEGSGIILSEDANNEYTYIITCAHVISDPGISVRVQLFDKTEYDAQVVGYDTRTDTGVVRIKAKGLKAAEFADSSLVQVGQSVYAIGNPGGVDFAGSFTSGMVSAIDRPISSSQSSYTMECIQHQAAINPGNSGGALVNAFGQVIGINSSKLVDGFEGMGFAVPSKVFQTVVNQIIANGYVPNRPKLGITYAPASALRTYYLIVKLKELPAGTIVIQGIANDSALAGTGAAVNDMIIAVNGKDLTSTDQLPALIEKSKVGDKLTLTLVRVTQDDYKTTRFDVTITLVEDRGNSTLPTEESTTAVPQDPFEDFTFPFDIY